MTMVGLSVLPRWFFLRCSTILVILLHTPVYLKEPQVKNIGILFE